MKLEIKELVGPYCVTWDDGNNIFRLAYNELREGGEIEVDFGGVVALAEPFIAGAFCQMLKLFGADVYGRVKVRHLSREQVEQLNDVIYGAMRRTVLDYDDELYRAVNREIITRQSGEVARPDRRRKRRLGGDDPSNV